MTARHNGPINLRRRDHPTMAHFLVRKRRCELIAQLQGDFANKHLSVTSPFGPFQDLANSQTVLNPSLQNHANLGANHRRSQIQSLQTRRRGL